MPAPKKRSSQAGSSQSKKRVKRTGNSSRGSVTKSGFTKNVSKKIEIKRVIATYSQSLSGSLPYVGVFPTPAAGDLSNQRDGRAIQVKGFQSRWTFTPAVATEYANIRVIYFRWKQNTTVPTINSVLELASTTDGLIAPYRVSTASLYSIVADDTYNANPLTVSSAGGNYARNQIPMNKSKAISFTQTFSGGTAGATDTALYVIFVGSGNGDIAGEVAQSYVDI